jgi:hypothetical protein
LSGELEAGGKFHRRSSGLGEQAEQRVKVSWAGPEARNRQRIRAAPLTSALDAG